MRKISKPFLRSHKTLELPHQNSFSGSQDSVQRSPLFRQMKQTTLSFAIEVEDHPARQEQLDLGDYFFATENQMIQSYRIVSLLGKGGYGTVYSAFDTTQQQVALKISRMDAYYVRALIAEADFQRTLGEAGVAPRFIDAFEYQGVYVMVSEMWPFTLSAVLKRSGGFSVRQIRQIGGQILLKLQQMHALQIVHADLKPDNIMLSQDLSLVRLIDFGTSVSLRNPQSHSSSYIQSRYYRAPESLFLKPPTTDIDVWSFGCILFEMHAGEPLFRVTNKYELCAMHVALLGPPPIEILCENVKLPQLSPNLRSSVQPYFQVYDALVFKQNRAHLEDLGFSQQSQVIPQQKVLAFRSKTQHQRRDIRFEIEGDRWQDLPFELGQFVTVLEGIFKWKDRSQLYQIQQGFFE